jgi:hypothetical protein
MASRGIRWTTLLAAAFALGGGCTSSTTSTDAAYVPTYYYSTVGYDPLYNPATDPFYYADPYWTFSRGDPNDSTTPPMPFDDLTAISTTLTALQKALAPVFGALKQLDTGGEADAGASVNDFPPKDLPAGTPFATFRLKIKSVTSGTRAWLLEAKPLGSADSAYKAVAAGTMGNLIADHQGKAVTVVGFTELHDVNTAAFPATGRAVIAAAAAQGQSKAVLTRLKDFSPDGVAAPTSGVLVGDRTSDGVTHIRVFSQQDVVPGANLENVTDRIAWRPGAGGGGYAFITDGDVDAGKYHMARSCWKDKSHLLFRDWRACDTTRAPADCLADPSTVVRVDAGSDPSVCSSYVAPTLPGTVITAADAATETAPVQPPTLPQDGNLTLPP